MSTGVATDVLNKTWTYDSDDDDTENINPQSDQNVISSNPTMAKLNLNATQVIITSKRMNMTTNVNCGDSVSVIDTTTTTNETCSYSKSLKYSSLPVIISTNSNQFAKASNEIKNFMEKFCVNECYESLFDEKLDNIDLE